MSSNNSQTNSKESTGENEAKMEIEQKSNVNDEAKKRKADEDVQRENGKQEKEENVHVKDESKMDIESSASSNSSSSSTSSTLPDYSTLSAKEKTFRLFNAYAQQVRKGCRELPSDTPCATEFCVGNGHFVALTGTDAGAKALELVRTHQQPKLCPRIAKKYGIPITPPPLPPTSTATPPTPLHPSSSSSASLSAAKPSPQKSPPKEVIAPLSVADVKAMIEAAKATNDYSHVIRRVGEVFSNLEALANSFAAANTIIKADAPHSASTTQYRSASSSSSSSSSTSSSSSSSSVRSPALTSITPPLPSSSSSSSSSPDGMTLEESKTTSPIDTEPSILSPAVDLSDLDAVFELLTADIDNPPKGTLSSALRDSLASALQRVLVIPASRASLASSSADYSPRLLRAFFIICHCSLLLDPDRKPLNKSLFRAVSVLNSATKSVFITWLIALDKDQLERLVGTIQQYITLSWISRAPLDEIVPAVRVLGFVEEANEVRKRRFPKLPAVDYKVFYNDAINEDVSVREEFIRWMRNEPTALSNYPFILEPAVKSRILQYESVFQQRRRFEHEALASLLHLNENNISPYLVLKVHRDQLVQDALSILQARDSVDLQKQLKVHFIGESGVDEGGLTKEFFQLIVSQLFDPKYGMFSHDIDTRTHRINPASLESIHEFELIGILLGMALYNTVILDIRFPLYYYKKLMGEKLTYEDFRCGYPAIAKGFDALLNFDGDVENTFGLTFTGQYESFGESVVVELKTNGKEISVNSDNRQEYVELYTDWLMNKSVEKPFQAFRDGFLMVCTGDAMRLFRSEEMELLTTGSPELDFHALESVTRYEEGFTKDSSTVKHFWSIVHNDLTLEQKKKLLHFATGSDRAPIRGLGSMPFIIARHGPDSDALPSSHTCFSILCLPDFGNRDKLKAKLLLAIQHATGFGLV